MAHISTPPIGRSQDDFPVVRQPRPTERRAALAVLLTGRPTPDDPSVDHFVSFADQQGMTLDGLWALFDRQVPVAASLIIPSAGRTAVAFISPVLSRRRIGDTTDLLRATIDAQNPKRFCLIQSLLDPTQRHEREALEEAGFSYLASLVYMRCSLAEPGKRPPVAPGSQASQPPSDLVAGEPIEVRGQPLNVIPWHEEDRDAFVRALETSYQDTLDCPGLVGIRQTQDILAGHRAVGRFDACWWSAFYLDDEPVGVMLLNPLVDRSELELVYLGLSPAYRGQGLAGRLLRRAVAQASLMRYTGLLLAVDEQNVPAMRLYRGLNFRVTGRKVAMIYALK